MLLSQRPESGNTALSAEKQGAGKINKTRLFELAVSRKPSSQIKIRKWLTTRKVPQFFPENGNNALKMLI